MFSQTKMQLESLEKSRNSQNQNLESSKKNKPREQPVEMIPHEVLHDNDVLKLRVEELAEEQERIQQNNNRIIQSISSIQNQINEAQSRKKKSKCL